MSYQSIDRPGQQWVEGECSKNLEADIAAGWADSIFIKSPATAMAEKPPLATKLLAVFIGHNSDLTVQLLTELQGGWLCGIVANGGQF
jgi:hypothetical protein